MKNVRTFNDFVNENQDVERVEEASYMDNMNKDQLEAYGDAIKKIRIPDGDSSKGDIVNWEDAANFLEKHKSYDKLPAGKQKYVKKAVGWAIQYQWMMER